MAGAAAMGAVVKPGGAIPGREANVAGMPNPGIVIGGAWTT